ncbi:hypothetical protein TNCT_458681 [Trichonephila clavata]|uniref:CCHC-type domain-containing protein n=1 Tax=Trichonephila clavata TaxID=2740835 RepID=A0A8X6GXV8_TRICU|nr:hypothetical protein TNCT_458681 [Trichonephila clavata]
MAPAENNIPHGQPQLKKQDLSKLVVSQLTPLTEEVISRQATINIGQNYVSWANDVKYLLMERQVWNIVDEKEIEPKLDASTDAEAVKEVKNFKAHEDFSERYVAFQLLRYLPPQFDSIVQTILRLDDVKFVYKDVVAELVAEEARLKLRNMDMNKEIAAQSTRMESKKRSIKTCYQCKSPDHLKNNCPELTSRRTTMNNSYRSPRRHFTPRNVKETYQHGKRCQSPTRQRQSQNNQTPNQRNNFHHRDVSPETVLGPRKRITFEASALMDKKLEFWHKRLAHVSPSSPTPFQKPHSGAVLEPVYLKFEPFEPFPDEDSRHESIVKDVSDKFSVATPESSEDETDEDSPDTRKPSTKTVNWFRKLVPRPDGSRTDVYYYQEGCTKRLRTLKDIEKYCKDHNLTFDSDIFNFSQSDTFHGVIDGSKGDASSSLSQT